MRIMFHRRWDELQPYAADWNRLLAGSCSDTIFLTWEWCEAWWKAYGNSRSLFVLTVWDGPDLVGVAPFYASRERRWARQWTCLRIIGDGSGDSDYLDCFAKRGQEPEIVSLLLQFLELVTHDWDWIQISGAPQDSPCLAALSEGALGRGWKCSSDSIACASLSLPSTWDAYLTSLRPRVRTKVRSALVHFEEQLRAAPAECSKIEEVDVWLQQLFDLHTRRWQDDHRPGVFRGKARQAFYRELSRSTLEKGWLAFHRLSWGDRPLALQYGFRYHNRLYVLQEGYDPSFDALRPGAALRGWVLRDGIAQGLAEYDFLAGNARHKLDWGARPKVSRVMRLARKPLAARASISLPRVTASLRESAAKRLPAALRSWRQTLLAWQRQRSWSNSGLPPTAMAKRFARWSASHLYRDTPLGSISRRLANQYVWKGSAKGPTSLHSRRVSICTIFRYHRVNDDGDPFFNALPISQFRAQMEYLARHFHLVSLDQLASGELPCNGHKHFIAVTFDDGYRDNFVHAFPALKKMGIPATIFLTTGYIESGELPWYDQVRLAFKLTLQRQISLDELGGPTASLDNEDQRLRALACSLAWLRTIDNDTRLRALPELFDRLRVPGELNLPSTMLSWPEVRQMQKGGISFGAHTVTHPVLGSLSVSRLEEEILGSKRAIENRIQVKARHFAYPFGKQADLGCDAKHVVQAAGFQTAVTTISGVNGPEQDPLELKRFSLEEPDLGIFGLKLDWSRMSA